MRKLLISAALIALFAAPGFGQDHDRGHGGGEPHSGGAPQGGAAPQGPQGGPPGGGHFNHGGGAPHGGPGPSFSRGPNGGGFEHQAPTNPTYSHGANGGGFDHRGNPAYTRGPNGGGFDHHDSGNPTYTRGPNGGFQNTPNMAGRPGGDFNRGGQGFNRGGPGGRHDFRGFGDFHQNFNAPRHFHAGAYRRPPGWYPHRWVFGEFLPSAFWARDYWLMDYVDFGLPPPPYGAVWVRYGDDALLIDEDTGEIITVEYGVFY